MLQGQNLQFQIHSRFTPTSDLKKEPAFESQF